RQPIVPCYFFTTREKICFRREWRSALVVKQLDWRVPYLPLARCLNFMWVKHGNLQISDLSSGCSFFRFREKFDYEVAITGNPWLLGATYVTVHRWHK
ncbi:hypothetical protein LINGRAHAP2_LOCUS4447, partial [Linum grandiflorum]